MHISRRMRLIWQELWLPPLLGLTADVLRAELVKQLGLNPGFNWALTILGLVLAGIVACGRYLIVPALPLDPTIDEELTKRIRLLYKKLGLPAVRVFVAPLSTRHDRGYAFQDGTDLFVDPDLLERPPGERDFIILFCALTRLNSGAFKWLCLLLFAGQELVLIRKALAGIDEELNDIVKTAVLIGALFCIHVALQVLHINERRFGVKANRWDVPILKVTEDLPGALDAIAWLKAKRLRKSAAMNADGLAAWWSKEKRLASTTTNIEVPAANADLTA
ncbi:MAG: hypothetical protein K1X67_16325 [Fimbriimonadaceae bacterium]|nr:hypothetical protein [Fimbriimonadaceae bacterium]